MKSLFSIAMLFCCLFSFAQSQSGTQVIMNNRPVIAKIKTNQTAYAGWLYKAETDSVFLLGNTKYKPVSMQAYDPMLDRRNVMSLPVTDIQTIQLSKKNRVTKGLWIGALGGIVTGMIVGAASYEEPDNNVDDFFRSFFGINKTNMMVVSGIMFSLLGGGLGAIVGAISTQKFAIMGEKAKYKEVQNQLRKKALIQ